MKITQVRLNNWKSFEDSGDIKLADINVIIGRNNTGKSALLRAIHLMQQASGLDLGDIRLGSGGAHIKISIEGPGLADDVRRYFDLNPETAGKVQGCASAVVSMRPMLIGGMVRAQPTLRVLGDEFGIRQIPAEEPINFLYTYLSKRKVVGFDRVVDRVRTVGVAQNLSNIVAKVARLANPDYVGAEEYNRLCTKVLGFRISTYASDGGQQAGISIGRHDHIPIEAMGEGVSSQLGIIADLCMAEGNVFLIEELENDVHPESLKALLDVIVEKSVNNQFIVTTHSNIVARYLGAAPNSRLFSVEANFTPGVVPTSSIRRVDDTPEARIEALRQLGYELYDSDLWDGWLILEESTAEFIIRNYLIPWFVPRLSRIRTLAAGGTDKVAPTFEDFRRLFLFAHLETHYRGRAWVVVDGDEPGKVIIDSLRKKYGSWTQEHFRTWSEGNFEYYYPAQFRARADAALSLSHDQKRDPKKHLFNEVKTWVDSVTMDEAMKAFEDSAAEVIALLRDIDDALFGQKAAAAP